MPPPPPPVPLHMPLCSTTLASTSSQVTRHNFVETLPHVKEALDGCDYFAFDCEMTGIHVHDPYRDREGKPPAFLDDVEDRYDEVRRRSSMECIIYILILICI